MGRRKGSVTTCTYCYNTGHNRRTCPEIKKIIKEEPNGWYAKRYGKGSVSKKRCSFCDEEGHTIRTCGEYKEAVTKYTDFNEVFQEKVAKSLKELGIGPGAVLTGVNTFLGEGGKDSYWVVTKINFDAINLAEWYHRGSTRKDRDERIFALQLKRMDTKNTKYAHYNTLQMSLLNEVYENAGLQKQDCSNTKKFKVLCRVPLVSTKGMNKTAGLNFLRKKEYSNGYSHAMLRNMIEKLNSGLEKGVNYQINDRIPF